MDLYYNHTKKCKFFEIQDYIVIHITLQTPKCCDVQNPIEALTLLHYFSGMLPFTLPLPSKYRRVGESSLDTSFN